MGISECAMRFRMAEVRGWVENDPVLAAEAWTLA